MNRPGFRRHSMAAFGRKLPMSDTHVSKIT